MAESAKSELPKRLRELAEAIERRDHAVELKDMKEPTQICFITNAEDHSDPLSKAIAREIRLMWPDIRTEALRRLHVSVDQLTHQVEMMLKERD